MPEGLFHFLSTFPNESVKKYWGWRFGKIFNALHLHLVIAWLIVIVSVRHLKKEPRNGCWLRATVSALHKNDMAENFKGKKFYWLAATAAAVGWLISAWLVANWMWLPPSFALRTTIFSVQLSTTEEGKQQQHIKQFIRYARVNSTAGELKNKDWNDETNWPKIRWRLQISNSFWTQCLLGPAGASWCPTQSVNVKRIHFPICLETRYIKAVIYI